LPVPGVDRPSETENRESADGTANTLVSVTFAGKAERAIAEGDGEYDPDVVIVSGEGSWARVPVLVQLNPVDDRLTAWEEGE